MKKTLSLFLIFLFLSGVFFLHAAFPADKPVRIINEEGQLNINCLSFSPDGEILAGGGCGTEGVWLWDPHTGRHLRTLKGHAGCIWAVPFSPDGQRLASGADDKTIRLWDVNTGRLLRTLTGHTHWIWSVAFSPDGQLLASGSEDNTIRLWDANSGQHLQSFTGHTSAVRSVVFSPDGKTLVSGSGDHWQDGVGFRRSGTYTLKFWDVQTGAQLRSLTGHTAAISSVAFSPDGQLVASGSEDRTVRLWDPHTGRHLRTLTGHRDIVFPVTFSPDGRLIASGGGKPQGAAPNDQKIRLWDVDSGELLSTLNPNYGDVEGLVFSPVVFGRDGYLLASGDGDRVSLWAIDALAGAGASFTIDAPSKVNVGERFTATISISEAVDLSGGQFTLGFNPAVLEVDDVNEGGFLNQDGSGTFFQVEKIDNVGGELSGIRLARFMKSGVSGSGTLLTVVFRAKRAGESSLQLRDVKLGNAFGDQIPADVSIAKVEVSPVPDVTGDGRVDILDLVRVTRHFGPAASAPAGVDVNGDGDVDILDLILLAQHLGN